MFGLEKMIACFKEQYGDSTEELIGALTKTLPKVALVNPFIDRKLLFEILQGAKAYQSPHTFEFCENIEPIIIDGLLSHYYLDRSSIFAPLLLPLTDGMRVLDMCSAPGGKLLMMLSRKLNLEITANDVSKDRTFRLRTVLNKFVPADILSNIRITTRDGNYFGLKEPNSYDAVLLDAPCSSEAHVASDEKQLRKYTGPSRGLPYRQYSLLASAFLALKPGGHVIYATCSINKNENEGVIKKLLNKKKSSCALVDFSLPLGKKGEMGYTILPHEHCAGPAFLSLIKKIS
jgi:16S rRNA C967 or C1407 C5-methylase (RsmB/RsmF family)